ncbi:hypothetical protein TNCV_2185641 [Trichonephila clavipes]|nr:hypothetical protein TNCV_2185641 [Trichonephila clavipes]
MMSRSCGSNKTAQHVPQLVPQSIIEKHIYSDKPPTLDHLENNNRRVIADIRPQMLEKVIENWTSRLDYIRASRGSHMPEIIFKICLSMPRGRHPASFGLVPEFDGGRIIAYKNCGLSFRGIGQRGDENKQP